MSWKYDDRDPISERIHQHIEDSAALKMMQGRKKDEKEEKPPREITRKTGRRLINCCLIVVYVICVLLATKFLTQEYEERFAKNLDCVMESIAPLSGGRASDIFLNELYNLSATEEEYQQFSAALYDKEGKRVQMTERYLCIPAKEKIYRFPMDEYFSEAEIERIQAYGGVNRWIEAEIDGETGKLVRMEFFMDPTVSTGESVWEWTGETETTENLVKVSARKVRTDMILIPYDNNNNLYERWTEDEYLQGLAETVALDELKDTENQRVLTILGDDEYKLVVRSSEKPLKAAMDGLMDMYVVGLIMVLISIGVVTYVLKRMTEKSTGQ